MQKKINLDRYRNNKNGEIYTVHNYNIIDATNGREDNDFMVLYERDGVWFARDRKEFFNKFTQVLDEDNSIDLSNVGKF